MSSMLSTREKAFAAIYTSERLLGATPEDAANAALEGYRNPPQGIDLVRDPLHNAENLSDALTRIEQMIRLSPHHQDERLTVPSGRPDSVSEADVSAFLRGFFPPGGDREIREP